MITEQQAISRLRRLAHDWPKTLWLFVDGNSISVMQTDDDGNRVYTRESDGSVDPNYIVASIDIPSDGGDW